MDHILNLIIRYPSLAPVRGRLEEALRILRQCFDRGGKLLVCGNGGSAADASHLCGELVKGFVKKRPLPANFSARFSTAPEDIRADLLESLQQGLPAIALGEAGAAVSATVNDNGARFMYAQQVCALGRPHDVFLGISTSGNAENVVYATYTARAFGLKTIALTGGSGGELAKIAGLAIIVPETETYKIQEYHLPVYHALCLALEEGFF
jgi:D-sedoheptulose 7-phosphate isomerase